MCPGLTAPSNGMITYSPDSTFPYFYGTTATYTCELGYTIVGDTTARMCVEASFGGGQWSDGTDPTCQGEANV